MSELDNKELTSEINDESEVSISSKITNSLSENELSEDNDEGAFQDSNKTKSKKLKKNKKLKHNKKSESSNEEDNETDVNSDEVAVGLLADGIKKSKNRITPSVKRTVILFVISIAALLATFGCQHLFSDTLKSADETEIVNWMFVTGKSDAAVNNASTYNQAEKSNLISKPLGDKYVHCIYNIDGSSNQRILRLVTQNSPLKVVVDGEEIFNNGYDKKKLVGNSYNEIVLPSSSAAQKLELFIYYPIGFNLQANIIDGVSTNPFSAENISDNIGMFLGGVIAIIGIALMLLIFVLMIRNRDIVVLLRLGGTIFLAGFVMLITEVTTHSSIFESTVWFSLTNTLEALLVCLVINNIHCLMLEKKKITGYLSFSAPILSLLIWVPNITVIRIGLILCAVAVAVSGVMLFKESANGNNIITENNPILQVVSVYVLLAYICNSFASAFSLWNYSAFLFDVSMTVLMLTLYFVYARNIAKNNLAEYAKEKKETDCKYIFDAVSDIISESSIFSSKEEFIIEFSKKTLEFLKKSELVLINDAVSVNIAIKRNGEFAEIYSCDNSPKNLDYKSIGEFLTLNEQKYTVGLSFIEMLIEDSEPVLIIFNNAYNSPESNLHNFISSLYNSVFLSYQSFSDNKEMVNNLNNMFINLAMITEKKANGTGTHLITVSKITELIAKEMGLNNADLIGKASILHDIGKITISSQILNKQGRLSSEEREIVKQHIFSGYNLLEGLSGELFEIAKSIVLEHHENFDGSGYLGKKADQISIYARIVRVCDVFDALVSKREYKDKWSYEAAIEYIFEHQGAEFDPQVVKAFLACGMEIIDIKENETQLS